MKRQNHTTQSITTVHLWLPRCVLLYYHLFAVYLIWNILKNVTCFHRKHAASFPLSLLAGLICKSNSISAMNTSAITWLFVNDSLTCSNLWCLTINRDVRWNISEMQRRTSVTQTPVTAFKNDDICFLLIILASSLFSFLIQSLNEHSE